MKERKRGMIPLVGIVTLNDNGRPALAYGRRCKQIEIPHELWVCEFSILTGLLLERSKKRGRAEPDGMAEKDGVRFWLEVDNSAKQTLEQYAAKWKRYQGTEGFVLVVAHADERLRRIMEWSAAVEGMALFNTFDGLAAGAAWTDRRGETVEI